MQVSSRTEEATGRDPVPCPPLIHSVFGQQALKRPEDPAVCDSAGTLSYGELNRRANQLAHRLRRLGVGPESLVALCLERGNPMLVAILGVLKAGGAYLPIDLECPKERIGFILEDARPVLVLTDEASAGRLPPGAPPSLCLEAQDRTMAEEPESDPPCQSTGANAAYVIYTSGSTGQPKGVIVTHANVVRLFTSTERWFGFSERDVWTLFHSFAFDFSVWEMWGALFYGGRLVVVPYLASRSPEAFYKLLVREKVTVLNQTPSAFRQLIWAEQASQAGANLELRWVIFGGEALDLRSLKPWLDRHGDSRPRLVNMYGITETTVHVTYRPISLQDVVSGKGSVIGQPIPDLRLNILDPKGQQCPIGEAGEICVGGAGVARGYLRRPDLTRQRFVPDPSSRFPGDRCYRSGDLARRTPDGDIEYLGRIDQQVKVRGFRIELGEIEAILSTHPQVRECVVSARGAASGDKQLVAYIVPQAQAPPVEELRVFLKQKLPEYMVPGVFVTLERLPLTINGKVDRQALPEPGKLRPELAAQYTAPATPDEKALAAIWERVLELDRIGVHDNFFALGGDSIRSIQVLAQAQGAGFRLSLEQLFGCPTVYELARQSDCAALERASDDPARLACLCPADRSRIPDWVCDAYPMAKLQIGMVYHSQLDPKSAVFHDVFSFGFKMPFEQTHFEQAVQRLADRHAIFRTSFDLGSYTEPLQLVHPAVRVPFTVADLGSHGTEQQRASLVDWVEAEKRRPFDFTQPPLLRLHVQRYSGEAFQLIVSFHHAIMDGWSLAAMLTELMRDYSRLLEGKTEDPGPPPVCYKDFVRMEKEAIASPAVRSYWQAKLAQPFIQALPRWPENLRTGGQEQVRGPEIDFPEETLEGLQRLARSAGAPLRSVLLAAHCRVMNVLTGQADILTGLVANGRPQVVGGERLIGLFLNTLPFRLPLEGGSWRDLVRQTFASECELLPHRRLPLSEIQQLAGGVPLFETVFDFVQFHVYRDLPGYGERSFVEDHYFEANNFALYVTFMLDASGSKLQMHFDYDPNELCPLQIRAMCDYYIQTIDAMARLPDSPYLAHCPLPEAERKRLLVDWNQTAQPIPDQCVHDLIREQAVKTPQAVAAVFGQHALSYEELDQQASALAGHLQKCGLSPGALAGIYLPRSLEMLISLLGVLKAGAGYVPLDPNYPAARLDFMIQDAGLELILTSSAVESRLSLERSRLICVDELKLAKRAAQHPREPWVSLTPTAQTPQATAYVIYTSGSTGKPKGVRVSHRALTNFLCSMRREPGISSDDSLLAVTTLSFDIAALELFLPLTIGGRIVIASSETALDPAALSASIEQHGVTLLQATPTTWNTLVQSGWKRNSRLKALCGGEPLSRELANQLLERCAQVWNMYGPTETTVWSCVHRIEADSGSVPIGRPIANTQIYLLNGQQQLVPTGSEGEICIGGCGLADGYLNRPELAAERFVPNPFESSGRARLYRTGDRGRYLRDGTLLCLGRTDQQVKLRGFRIEPGEIEAVLNQHPAVSTSAVALKASSSLDKRLVAYFIPRTTVTSTDLRDFLARKLPAYMLPSAYVELAEFPCTPNGKLDRRQLPDPSEARPDLDVPFVAPRTPVEEHVAALWGEILRLERIGLHDNFFALGGHSLLAIQVVARLRHELSAELPLAALFENSTLEEFARSVTETLLNAENLEATGGEAADPPGKCQHGNGLPTPALSNL